MRIATKTFALNRDCNSAAPCAVPRAIVMISTPVPKTTAFPLSAPQMILIAARLKTLVAAHLNGTLASPAAKYRLRLHLTAAHSRQLAHGVLPAKSRTISLAIPSAMSAARQSTASMCLAISITHLWRYRCVFSPASVSSASLLAELRLDPLAMIQQPRQRPPPPTQLLPHPHLHLLLPPCLTALELD